MESEDVQQLPSPVRPAAVPAAAIAAAAAAGRRPSTHASSGADPSQASQVSSWLKKRGKKSRGRCSDEQVEQFKRIFQDMTDSTKLGSGSGSNGGVDLADLDASLRQLGIEMALPAALHPSHRQRRSSLLSADTQASPPASSSPQQPAHAAPQPGPPALTSASPPRGRRHSLCDPSPSSSCPSAFPSASPAEQLDLEAFIAIMSATLERMAGEGHLSDIFQGQAIPALEIMGKTYRRRRMLDGMLSNSPESGRFWQNLMQLNASHQRDAMLAQLKDSGFVAAPQVASHAKASHSAATSSHASPISHDRIPGHVGSPSGRCYTGSRASTSHSPYRPHLGVSVAGDGYTHIHTQQHQQHQQQCRPGSSSMPLWQGTAAGGAGNGARDALRSRGSGFGPGLGHPDNRPSGRSSPMQPTARSASPLGEHFGHAECPRRASASVAVAGSGIPSAFRAQGMGCRPNGGAVIATFQYLTSTPQLLDLKFTRPTLRLPTHAQARSVSPTPASDREASHA